MPPSDEFQLISPEGAWSEGPAEKPAQVFQRVYRELKPRTDPPPVDVRFEKFVNADSFIRYQDRRLLVRISDLLEGAPVQVVESLAFILLCKLLRKKIPPVHSHRYRLFLNRKEMRNRAQLVRQERGRKLVLDPKGAFYDLSEIFEEMNQAYFHGLMARPALGWSLRRSRTRLGHFDPSHNTIVISRIFDQPDVSRVALEYVMFHEMLHLQFPVEHRTTRRCVHTKEFKEAEKGFRMLQEARQLLKML